LANNNFGMIVLQTLRQMQTKVPLFVQLSFYTGNVLLQDFSLSSNSIESTYNLKLKQTSLYQDFKSVKFDGQVQSAKPIFSIGG